MIEKQCNYCDNKLLRKRKNKNDRYYCDSRCQMNHEYKTGLRDRNKTVEKARNIAHAKMVKHNWLNDKSSRDKLKEVQNTEEYRLKMSKMRIGSKNPMFGLFGKLAGHFKGGSYRKSGTASRGAGWKIIKLKIKQRDNYTCQNCGIKEEHVEQYLQVHHIVPYKCTQDNSENNLITLCSKCHALKEPKFYKIKSIKKKPFDGTVYNFSVKDDESYVANKMVVHNCRSTLGYVKVDEE